MAKSNTLEQMDLTDIFKTFYPNKAFLSRSLGTFSSIDHILGHNTRLNKCKKINASFLNTGLAMKPEINHKEKIRKNNEYTEV